MDGVSPTRQAVIDALVAERYGKPVREFGPVMGPTLEAQIAAQEAEDALLEAEEAGRLLEERRKALSDAGYERRTRKKREQRLAREQEAM